MLLLAAGSPKHTAGFLDQCRSTNKHLTPAFVHLPGVSLVNATLRCGGDGHLYCIKETRMFSRLSRGKAAEDTDPFLLQVCVQRSIATCFAEVWTSMVDQTRLLSLRKKGISLQSYTRMTNLPQKKPGKLSNPSHDGISFLLRVEGFAKIKPLAHPISPCPRCLVLRNDGERLCC